MSDSFAVRLPVTAVVLNWNGWKDTVQCLHGLFGLHDAPRQIVVCDNGSSDESIDALEHWARECSCVWDEDRSLRWARVVVPSTGRPAELRTDRFDLDLILLCIDTNLGFGGGLNIGLRWALQDSAVDHVWLLNNDTVPEPDSLARLMMATRTMPNCGVFGSTIVAYDCPSRTHGHFGVLIPWWSKTRHAVGKSRMGGDHPVLQLSHHQYPIGAALLLTREAAEWSSGFADDYFLYFEELDLVHRLRPEFCAAVAVDSIVRHREAATTGALAGGGSLISDYCFARSRVVFAKRFYPWCVPSVVLAVVASALWRLCRGRRFNAFAVGAGLRDGLLNKIGIPRAWLREPAS
jgi:GT2 family glycosyltransferase